ncbi:MAG TPA: Rieske 2Fe-2S domain-containing protein [Patescibacteria group bacterium]|nr:Rieske 2Fe-2S domain-containing protein [Patescibacteria group bacterium]
MSFTRVARVEDLKPGQSRSLRVGIRRIAVFNVDGLFYAIEDACRHMKAPLSTGRVVGTTLTCSWHGWKYEITTGACHDKDWGCVRTFPVKVEGGEILVSDTENPRPEAEAGEDPDDIPTPVFRS